MVDFYNKSSRQIRVGFADESVKQQYDELEKGKFEEKQLHFFIWRAMGDLKENPRCGIEVPKDRIPKKYIQKYGINNIWRYALPNGWRLVYSIKGQEVEILAIVLEWFDHKTYEKRFGYL